MAGIGLFARWQIIRLPDAPSIPSGTITKANAATPPATLDSPFDRTVIEFQSTPFYQRYQQHPAVTALLDGKGRLEASESLKSLLNLAKAVTFAVDGRLILEVNVRGDAVHRKAQARELARTQLRQIWMLLGTKMPEDTFERAFQAGEYAPGRMLGASNFAATVSYPEDLKPPN